MDGKCGSRRTGASAGTRTTLCLFGIEPAGAARCRSFTSDGKQSVGVRVEADDLPSGAIAFDSELPAGLARQAYWPGDGGVAFHWAVSSMTGGGWRPLVEHAYRRRAAGRAQATAGTWQRPAAGLASGSQTDDGEARAPGRALAQSEPARATS
ncbi:MAG: hypothetical protein R3C15_21280 [Thermoleophilia bacterium]